MSISLDFAPKRSILVVDDTPDNLSLLTESALDKAWIVRLKMRDPAELQGLLSYAEYVKHCDKDRH